MARAKLADEKEFIPADLLQARMLLKALRLQGTPVSKARGIVAWLLELPDDLGDDSLRARYRAELARLGTPPWDRGTGAEELITHSYPYRGDRIVAIGAGRDDVQVARAA